MKSISKNLALRALHVSRLNQFAFRSRPNHLLALGYHGILSAPASSPFRYHHTEAEFRSHLRWVTKHATPIGLQDLFAWSSGQRSFLKPPVLITFDDGYRNNLTIAAPILKELGIPAVFFVTTGYIGTNSVLWTDEVYLRVQNWTEPVFLGPGDTKLFLSPDRAERNYTAHFVVEACKNICDAARLEYIEYLRRYSPDVPVMVHREAQELMSWNEVCSLVKSGFDVGSHTVTHPILSQTSRERLRRELFESRSVIQDRTGTECAALAYPNGRAVDISPDVLELTREAGYRLAFTISGKRCRPASDLMLIDRICPPGHTSLSTFALWAGGAREWAARKNRKPEAVALAPAGPL